MKAYNMPVHRHFHNDVPKVVSYVMDDVPRWISLSFRT